MPLTEYQPGTAFPGVIGRTFDVSRPAWPRPLRVLVSQGGIDGGFSLHVQGGRLPYTYNYVARDWFTIESDRELPSGRHALNYELEPTGPASILEGKGTPGVGRLFVDGQPAGRGDLPVTDAYNPPYAFTGTIDRVVYDVSGDHVVDHEAEIRMVPARQ